MRIVFITTLVFISLLFAEDKSKFPFISLNTTKADVFIKDNPRLNGNGTVVFILDSGVDMGVQGLMVLPDGSPKVIDVQDFSGQGDVFLQSAFEEKDEEGTYLTDGAIKLYGQDRLADYPKDSLFLIGSFSEAQLTNSDVEDANNDGNYDDTFGVLVFKIEHENEEEWVAYIDTDGDTNIDDEKAVRNYSKNYDIVKLRGRNKEFAPHILSIGINIFPGESRIVFHFDDNAHGTHCAGIAAGYKIHGQEGFNGVAPGARVISLKIGNNTLSGGATVSGSMIAAFNYAADYAARYPEYYYILNMSYGIGSEIEGKSEIDLFLDQFFRDNPHLTLCTSNGNEGPGISTSGTPAASHRIIATGAVLPEESARNTYGFFTRDHEIFNFSSRGGDSEKPDIVAPGAASSTVPYFENRENMWGTSMASPHAAGGIALLLSALKTSYPDAKPDNLLLKRALQNTAIPLMGYSWVDQGAGLINIPQAWKKLKDLYADSRESEPIDYKIEAPSTEFTDQKGYTVFYNSSGYIPDGAQGISITPRLPAAWDADKKEKYFQSFNILTEGNFFSVRQQEKYFKGKNAANLDLHFDKKKTQSPGLYTGMIYGIPKEKSRDRGNAVFRVPVAVVRPHFFSNANNAKLSFKTKDLQAGKIERYFIHVDDDMTALKLIMKNDDAPDDRFRLYVFDQEGRNIYTNYSNEKQDEVILLPQDNERGTWEIVVFSEYTNRGSIALKLQLEAHYISVSSLINPDLIWEAGSTPRGRVTFLNAGTSPVKARLSGKVVGYTMKKVFNVNGEEYRLPVKKDRFIDRIEFEIEILNDDFQKLTDFAINILDYDGTAVIQEGLSYKKTKIVFYPDDNVEYQMEFISGFAYKYQSGWSMSITETRYFSLPYQLFTYPDTFSKLDLFPLKPLTATFDVEEPLPSLPQGFRYKFNFSFSDDKRDIRIPVNY